MKSWRRCWTRLARKGTFPVVAFELEFYLFDSSCGRPAAVAGDALTGDADDQPNMHIERLSRFAPVLDEMVEATHVPKVSMPR